jgi:hypothetical protein
MSELNYNTLPDLAEAVEKYEVFSAMAICNEYMQYAIPPLPWNEHTTHVSQHSTPRSVLSRS